MDWIRIGIGLTQAILIVYSVALLAVIIERGVTLRRKRLAEAREFPALRQATRKTLSTGGQGPVAQALQAALTNLPAELTEARVKEAVGQEILVQTTALQTNFSYLATIASTAPYIGLFGTVLGILAAFRKIAASGETGAAIVAGGISEALITTALGLAVAIPAVIAYNQLLAQVNALSLTIENHALTVATNLVESGATATPTTAAPITVAAPTAPKNTPTTLYAMPEGGQ